MGDSVVIFMLVTLGLLLLSAGIEDVRTREIANWKNGAIAALAPVWWWVAGYALWPDVAIQIGVALTIFGLFVIAFQFGQMGGGDVKLIGALALWLPFTPLIWMLIVMSLIGGALTCALVVEAKLRPSGRDLEIPYGVAIAIAGLLWIREPILNHFG